MARRAAPARFALALLGASLISATGPARAEDLVALGRKVFTEMAEPRCGLCHTLRDAGTQGEVGPVLDTLKPDAARVKAAVENGIGVMPAFEELSPEQIDAVAAYVANATGGARPN